MIINDKSYIPHTIFTSTSWHQPYYLSVFFRNLSKKKPEPRGLTAEWMTSNLENEKERRPWRPKKQSGVALVCIFPYYNFLQPWQKRRRWRQRRGDRQVGLAQEGRPRDLRSRVRYVLVVSLNYHFEQLPFASTFVWLFLVNNSLSLVLNTAIEYLQINLQNILFALRVSFSLPT